MICKCGKRATIESIVNGIEHYICEYCKRKFSIRENGLATDREIERLQQSQLKQIVRSGVYKPPRFEIGQVSSLRMYNPITEREKGFEREYELKYAKSR